jgi:hypothetical protein
MIKVGRIKIGLKFYLFLTYFIKEPIKIVKVTRPLHAPPLYPVATTLRCCFASLSF